jgi:hypothetical protein
MSDTKKTEVSEEQLHGWLNRINQLESENNELKADIKKLSQFFTFFTPFFASGGNPMAAITKILSPANLNKMTPMVEEILPVINKYNQSELLS